MACRPHVIHRGLDRRRVARVDLNTGIPRYALACLTYIILCGHTRTQLPDPCDCTRRQWY